MRSNRHLNLFLAGLLAISTAAADTADPLFRSAETMNVEITAPLSTLVRERSETEYLQGVFSYTEADGTPVTLDVGLRARGNFRHRNCDFPPVTLNFRRSQVGGTLFDQQNKLRMVVHCKITRRYEQSVVREYMAYRLLNLVTDRSFRVRLLNVVWTDSEGRSGTVVRSAFLVEHKNRLAARIGLAEQEVERAELDAIDPDHLNLVSIFQYLIGNVDFSPLAGSGGECCHNNAMFGPSADELVAIPYDFDFSGFVNAPNAVIDRERGVEWLGQRVYRGYCANNDRVPASIQRFSEARENVDALVAGQAALEPVVRRNIAAYIDEFYAVVDDPREVERLIIGACH